MRVPAGRAVRMKGRELKAKVREYRKLTAYFRRWLLRRQTQPT